MSGVPPSPSADAPPAWRRAWGRLPRGLRILILFVAGAYASIALLILCVAGLSQLVGHVLDAQESKPRVNFERNLAHPVPEGVEIVSSQFESGSGWGWKTSWLHFTAPAAVTEKLIQDHRLQPTRLEASTLAGLQRPDWQPSGNAFRADFPRKAGDPAYGIILVREREGTRVWTYKGPLPFDGFSPSSTPTGHDEKSEGIQAPPSVTGTGRSPS